MSEAATPSNACALVHERLTGAAEALRAVRSTLRGNLSVHRCAHTLSFEQIDRFLHALTSLSITHPFGEPLIGSIDGTLVVSVRIGASYARAPKRLRDDGQTHAGLEACVRIGRRMRANTLALREVRVLRDVCLQTSEARRTVVWCRIAGGVPVALRVIKMAYAEDADDGMLAASDAYVPLPIRAPHDDEHAEEPVLHCFGSVRNASSLTTTIPTISDANEPCAKRSRT